MFYHNLQPEIAKHVHGNHRSKVYGLIVDFSPLVLSRYFFSADQVDGICLTGLNWGEGFPNYNHALALQSLHEPNCPNPLSVKVGDLTVENRLLHHFVTHMILPRGGNKTELTSWDVGIMFFINNRVKINLPHLIFSHVTQVARKSNASCVYAMPLTSLLIHGLGCDSVPTDAVNVVDGHLMYSDMSLTLLFKQNPDTGIWGRSQPYAHLGPSDTRPSSTHDRSHEPTFDIPSSSSGPSVQPSVDNRFDRIEEGLSNLINISNQNSEDIRLLGVDLFTRMSSLENVVMGRLGTMDDAVASLKQELKSARSDIRSYFDSSHPPNS